MLSRNRNRSKSHIPNQSLFGTIGFCSVYESNKSIVFGHVFILKFTIFTILLKVLMNLKINFYYSRTIFIFTNTPILKVVILISIFYYFCCAARDRKRGKNCSLLNFLNLKKNQTDKIFKTSDTHQKKNPKISINILHIKLFFLYIRDINSLNSN